MPSSPTPAEALTWGFRSRLPWPAARGERLWAQLTSVKGLSQYDVELCEPSAGHIALVLVKKHVSTAAPGTPGPAPSAAGGASPPLGRRGSTPLVTAAAHTGAAAAVSSRVVFVLDAIPPPRKATSPAKVQQKQSASQSLRSLSPASTGSTMSSNGGAVLPDSTGGLPLQQQQDVDELDLIDELFAAAKVGKDGAILAKSPLLSARFDCKVVAIKFMRGNASASSSLSRSQQQRSASGTTTLRCVVAREDGMAFIWEWGSDLHQWTFLNQFCFLENPNLKWTKPVVAFTATEMAWHGETTEFAWWSMESKQEPKLCLRKIQYAQEQSTFRTEITIGNPFSLTCTQVVGLQSSRLGLWIVTRAMGVHFRSAESLRMVSLSWHAVLSGDNNNGVKDVDTIKAAMADPASQLLTCLHNVTGELLVLVRGSGAVYLVSSKDPKHPQQQQQGLKAKQLTTLNSWSPSMAEDAVSIAAHRHLLLVVTSETLLAFSYLTGEQLATIELPHSSSENFHPTSKAVVRSPPPALWTITGAASSVGLWSSTGFWFLTTPSAKAVGSSLNPLMINSSQRLTQQYQQQGGSGNPRAAFESLAKYGESLKFETALQALEILEKVCKSLDACDEQVLSTVFQSLSSPALLLAVFADHSVPEALVDELARIVASLHQIAHEITVGGRFASSWEKGDASTKSADSQYQYSLAQKLTPANVEALHHLSNWVLLAKRKITRLQTSAYFKGRHHMRPRAVSALTTAASDEPFSTFSPLEGDDDPDASNFRLSRKLRPMSSLRFASGSCALHHGKQWLVQLESFLLDGVVFKKSASGEGSSSNNHGAVPSHLLFHEERQLEDYRSSNSSFSKHMYVESMSRLYLLHEPASLLPFVRCVSEYCPRLFSLSGATRVSRSHAERALTLFPPLEFFVERFVREQLQLKQQQSVGSSSTKTLSQSQKKKRHKELGAAPAKNSLLAYAALLCRCGYYLEACHGLLQCDLYEHCRGSLFVNNLLKTSEDRDGFDDAQVLEGEQLDAVRGAVYFALLEYCVKHRDVAELQLLLELKPVHVSVLHVLRALRNHLPQKVAKKNEGENTGGSGSAYEQVTVGKLRPVLLALLKQQKAAPVQVA